MKNNAFHIGPEHTPDFIIGGAMKAGTSTLHQILAEHPRVFIPKEELGYFDIDSLFQHSDFFFYDRSSDHWTAPFPEADPERFREWYEGHFEGKGDCLKGEDSTTYLASKVAAERIAAGEKPVKLIFLLRHPSERARSQYYHMLRSGRAIYSFEDTIRFDPDSILERSLYKEQLEAYYERIPREQIQVLLFEDLVADPKGTLEEVCRFLELDPQEIDESSLSKHSNPSRLPRYPKLQAFRNRLFRGFGNIRYLNKLPVTPQGKGVQPSLPLRLLDRVHDRINPQKVRRTPSLPPGTQAFLDRYFQRELEGLDELVGKPLMSRWFGE